MVLRCLCFSLRFSLSSAASAAASAAALLGLVVSAPVRAALGLRSLGVRLAMAPPVELLVTLVGHEVLTALSGLTRLTLVGVPAVSVASLLGNRENLSESHLLTCFLKLGDHLVDVVFPFLAHVVLLVQKT